MPTELFHYTSFASFIQILESRVIWASHIYYLNDGSEFRYAIHLLQHMLSEFRELQPSSAAHIQRLETAVDDLRQPEAAVYVASFSEDGDSLSQWRAYCPPGRGLSFGVDLTHLEIASARQGFTLHDCIYDPSEQSELLKVMVADQLGRHNDLDPNDSELHNNRVLEFIEEFTRVAATFKHPSFEEEREWRLISRPVGPTHRRVKYRQGASTIVPYFEFELPADGDSLQISTAIVGPTPLMDLAGPAVTGVCLKYRLAWKGTRPSQIPYRPW